MSGNRLLRDALAEERKYKISGGIYHKLQIDFAYNSNHIEGSRLTHEQTRYIYETKSVGIEPTRVNDIIEAVNHFRCFDYVLDNLSVPLSEDFIKSLHRILKQGLFLDDASEAIIGDYKKYPNEVGEITTVHPSQVPTKLFLLISQYNRLHDVTLYDIADFHARFELIHPFYDGNGRVGRLIMLKQCLENNIEPCIITEDLKLFYYKGLKEWQTENKKERLIDTLLLAQSDVKAALDYFEIQYDTTTPKANELISARKITAAPDQTHRRR